MAQITLRGIGNAAQIINAVDQEIEQSGMSVDIVGRNTLHLDDVTVYLRVYEKFYYRAGNRVSLTLMLCESRGEIHATAVSAGGGNGVFLRFSWGAEESFLTVVEQALRHHGLH